MQRYRMTVAYDGTDFHGWQHQPGLRTVQETVRQSLIHTFAQPVQLQGASRTDAGVHAEGQVVHFDVDSRIPLERMAMAINARLPADIEVREVQPVADDFDATRDAIDKQYCYRIWNADRRPLGLRHQVYHYWVPLDAERMNQAAGRIVGEHDFAGFATAGHGRLSTVRTVHTCEVQRHGDQVHLTVSGSGFLYNMVRIITGTLIEVGRGKWPPEHVDRILAEADRRLAGPTVPPGGLCLQWIAYDA
ncbi:tRNA pseudouridine(38-40) synthase TruA [Planctomycetales bacterium ZRK34]|nr:tRNA pseudouridine(38-40) synthase TruA [Planctomycetales bacterium ZRK34]